MNNGKTPGLLTLKGVQIKRLPFKVEKLGDFLWYESPLFSHLFTEQNEDFLIKWCSQDADFNRWLLYKTNYNLLFDYFNGKIGDLELVLKNPDGFAFIVDIDHDIEWRRVFLIAVEDIPEAYLPESSARYDVETFEPYAEKLHAYLDFHFARQQKRPEPAVRLAVA